MLNPNNATQLVQGYHKRQSIVNSCWQTGMFKWFSAVIFTVEVTGFKVLDLSFRLTKWWELKLFCSSELRRILSFKNAVSLPCFRWWKVASDLMEVQWTVSRQCILHTNTCNYRDILLLKLSQIKFCNTAGYLRRELRTHTEQNQKPSAWFVHV